MLLLVYVIYLQLGLHMTSRTVDSGSRRRVAHQGQVRLSRGCPMHKSGRVVPVGVDIGSYFAVHCIKDSVQLHQIAGDSRMFTKVSLFLREIFFHIRS
jgi:hypothetical protein